MFKIRQNSKICQFFFNSTEIIVTSRFKLIFTYIPNIIIMKYIRKTLIFLSGLIFSVSGNLFSQDLNTIKNLTNKVKDKTVNTLNIVFDDPELNRVWGESKSFINEKYEKEWKETIINFSQSYDVTDFNYAVSFGDNSTPYESKSNIKQAKSFAYYLADPTNVSEIPPKIKGQNLNYTGEILYVSSSYKMSEKSFLKAYEIYEKENMTDSTFANLTLSNLGLLYHTTGRYALAEEYSLKALEKREKGNDNTGLAASLNNIAVLYKDMGYYTQAEEYIVKARKQLEEEGDTKSIKYAIVLNNLAMIYQMTGKYKDAENYLKQSLKIAETEVQEKSPTYVRLDVNLAMLYQLTKRYEEAEVIYLDAIKIKKRRMGSNHPDYAMLLRNTASLYQQMRKFDKVEKMLTEAVGIYESQFGKENPSYAQSIYELGLFYQSQNRITEAEPLFNQALDIQKKTLSEHHPNLTLTYENLAILYWQKEDYKNAALLFKQTLNEYIYQINTFFPAMNEYEKTMFWNKIEPKFIRFYNFAVEAYPQMPEISGDVFDFRIATKALLLNASRKVKDRILNSGNKTLIAKYNNWQDSKNWLAKLYTYTDEELQAESINVDSIETVVSDLEKELTKLSEEFKKASELRYITYKDIALLLKPEEAAVEIVRINEFSYIYPKTQIHYLALVLKNNNTYPDMVFMKNGDAMESTQFEEYKTTVHSGKSMEPFFDYYWKDVHTFTSEEKKLYISIDGIYNRVNINTVQLPSGRSMLDYTDIHFVTNTKDLLSFNNKKTITKSAFLLGFPDYKMDLPQDLARLTPLPGTEKEVNTIQTLLKGKAYTVKTIMARNATEGNLKKVNNPAILHIATHGYFLENSVAESEETRAFGIEPMKAYENPLLRSGLLLAGADRTINEMNTKDNKDSDDGILNAFEAMVLKLDNTDLVILSACQTGLGEIKNGEGVYGLQRSFQIAGASSIITSLWEVSDEGTQDLMSAFYKYWLQTGNKHEAFRKAQLEIKEKYQYPFYWGAFVLVGD
jgi:tetratricopeptide (TPR) repeat protein